MKKLIAALLLVVCSFALVACSSSSEEAPAEEKTAQQIDLEIYKPVRSAAASYDKINTMMAQLESGETSVQELGDYCQQVIDWGVDWTGELDAITADGTEEYVDISTTYVTNVCAVALYLSNYIEDNSLEDLQKANDTLPLLPDALAEVNAVRETYLTDSGYSAEEVEKILAAG